MEVTSSAQVLSIYLLLIAFFYDKTDGFKDEPNRLRYSILKSLPVLFLAAVVHLGYGNVKGRMRHFLSAALCACAFGDFLISAYRDMELSFALSATVFGIGHILYMAGFAPQLKCFSPRLTMGICLYAVVMIWRFLLPNFGTHPFTTTTLIAYSLLLSLALLFSGSLALEGTRLQAPRQKNNLLRFAGYLLFFVSDSLLLLEHAEIVLPCKEVAILSTYYTAQFLITSGALETEQMI